MEPYSKLLLQNQVCHSLYSAANALVRAYRPLLSELDLTYPQYLVMLSLWEKDQVTVKHLAEHTRFDSATLTPILKRLEGKGWVARLRSTEDERRRVITLTKEGKELIQSAKSIPDNLSCSIDMSLDEALMLKKLAEKLYQQLV